MMRTIKGVRAVSEIKISANGGEAFWQPALLFIRNICLLSVGFGCAIPPSCGIGVWTSATTSGIFVVPCCALACVSVFTATVGVGGFTLIGK